MAEKKKIRKNHIVVFQDENDNVLKTSFVPHKGAAVPPEIPEKKEASKHFEYHFDGWDTDYSSVVTNLVLRPVYKKVPKKYLVMYFHEDGKLLGMESVPYGEAAKADIHPVKKDTARYEYIFKGWNCSLESIQGDTNAKALFERKTKSFRVSFYHEDGSLLKEETVFYGEKANPPQEPEKESDEMYHYIFEGWDRDFSSVTGNLQVYAHFQSVYNEYTISFFLEGEEVESAQYHFGDKIIYPDLKKKRYEVVWEKHPDYVEASGSLFASFEYANPKGKQFSQDGHIFEIKNPSSTNGTVICRHFCASGEEKVVVPEKVKLGDYYYRIDEIGSYAFEKCDNMKQLTLPSSVSVLEAYGLANCAKLRRLCAPALREIGEKAFAGDVCLKEIDAQGGRLKKLHRNAFEKLSGQICLRTDSHTMQRLKKNYPKIFQKGNILPECSDFR